VTKYRNESNGNYSEVTTAGMMLIKVTTSPMRKRRKAIPYVIGFAAVFSLTYILILYIVNVLVPGYTGEYFMLDNYLFIHLKMTADKVNHLPDICRKCYPTEVSIVIQMKKGDNQDRNDANSLALVKLHTYPNTVKRRIFHKLFPAKVSIYGMALTLTGNYISTNLSVPTYRDQNLRIKFRGKEVPMSFQKLTTVNLSEKGLAIDLCKRLKTGFPNERQYDISVSKKTFTILGVGHFYNFFFADNSKKVKFEELVTKVSPDLIVFLGDSIIGPTKCDDPEIALDQWSEFESLIQRIAIPSYSVPGNHDGSSGISCLTFFMEEMWNKYRLNYSLIRFHSNEWEYFVGFLNSSGYYVPNYQMEHFNAWSDKGSTKEGSQRIVFIHHQRAKNLYKSAASILVKGTIVLSGDEQPKLQNTQFIEDGIVFQNTTTFREDHLEYLIIRLGKKLVIKSDKLPY